jgi:hypothetical protein
MNPFEKSYTGCRRFRKGTEPMASFTLVIVRHNGFAEDVAVVIHAGYRR